MTDGPGAHEQPMDDAYRSFFRPDETPEPVAPEAAAPAVESTPELSFTRPAADTGRLFRSLGADDAAGALPAITADEAAHLRTVGAAAAAPAAVVTTPAPAAPAGAAAAPIPAAPLVDPGHPTPSKEMPEMAQRRRPDTGLSPMGVYLIVIGAALAFGLVDSKVGGAGLGWITGIGVLLATVYCALKVRTSDASVAVIAPPIAYGVAALTVAQLGQSRAGGTLIAAANNAFFALADNWFWVIGTTLVALAIVVVRARR